MAKNILSWLGVSREEAAEPEMAAVTTDEVPEILQAARNEIARLKKDAEWTENRYREDIAAFKAVIDQQGAEVKELTAKLAEAEQRANDESESAREKAIAMLSQVGQPPVDVSAAQGAVQTHNEEIREKYLRMKPGAERRAFRMEHEEILKTEG